MKRLAYMNTIEQIGARCYFLWDPLKNALVLELKDGDWDLFVELCNQEPSSLNKREILVAALTDYAFVFQTEAIQIINRLIKEGKNIDAFLIALEAAFNIGNLDPLIKLAEHKDNDVRKGAVRFVTYLWREQPEKALKIIEQKAKMISRFFLPNVRILDFCINSSALILMEGYQDILLIERLRRMWVEILDKLLFRGLDNVKGVGSAIRKLRVWSVVGLAQIAWKFTGNLILEGVGYDRQDMETLFDQSQHEWDRFNRIVSFLDVQATNVEDLREDFQEVIKTDNLVQNWLMELVLMLHSFETDSPILSPETIPVIPFIKSLFDYTSQFSPARTSYSYLFIALTASGRGYRSESVDEAYIQIFEDCLNTYYHKFNCCSLNTRGHGDKATGFGYYTQLFYIRDAKLQSPFLDRVLDDAFERNDIDFLMRYVQDVTVVSHPKARKAWAMFLAVQSVLSRLERLKNEEEQQELEDVLVKSLTRIQIYYPREIEHFLDTLNTNDEIIAQIIKRVRTGEREEYVSNMFIRGQWLIRDLVLDTPDKFLLRQLVWWVQQADSARNFGAWFSLFLRMIVNFLYLPDNELVFASPDLRTNLTKQD